jgi:hypothetical protein
VSWIAFYPVEAMAAGETICFCVDGSFSRGYDFTMFGVLANEKLSRQDAKLP